jgi:hypothetical protein
MTKDFVLERAHESCSRQRTRGSASLPYETRDEAGTRCCAAALRLFGSRIAKVALLVLSLLPMASAAELSFDFTKSEIPAGFHSTVSGEGKPGIWKIVEDEVPNEMSRLRPNSPAPKKNVLAQLSRDITDEHYPILVYTNEVFGDFTFSTRVKCVGGAIEQMAGVVFRYQDEQNYYYLRASAKGNTFRFFKVVGGQRSAPIGPEMQIPAGQWHDLAVECKANVIKCFLNGKQAIPDLTDNSFVAGKIGFWTKSDSVSHFTDAQIRFTPREPFVRVLLREMKEKYPRVLGLRVYGKTAENPNLRVMASTDESELGQAGTEVEQQIFSMDTPFFGRLKKGVVVTLPVHDRNGDVIAALRVEMTSFLGQTENNALARATPIAKDIERRIVEATDLF